VLGGGHEGARDVDASCKHIAGCHGSRARRSLADLLEAVCDGGNPGASVDQQRIKGADPHEFADEGGGPRLHIRLLKEHYGGAPGEFDCGEKAEESVGKWPDRREPVGSLSAVLIEDGAGRLLCMRQRREDDCDRHRTEH
jgi:hypothetical protein